MLSVQLLDRAGSRAPIAIDGGIDASNAARVVAAGAEILVAGQAIFGQGDAERATRDLRAAASRRPELVKHVTAAELDVARPRALRRNRQDGRRLLRELLRVVRGRADATCCGRSAGATARWKLAGVSLPVIDAHCEYVRPARYDDELEIRTTGRLLSPVRLEFTYEVRLAAQATVAATGRTTHASVDPGRSAVPVADNDSGGLCVKALVTGAAGFIGSHLTAASARSRRGSDGHRLLHRLLSALHQGSEPRRQRARPGFHFIEGIAAVADLAALLEGKTHVFHLAAQAGVRKSWGSDFRIYTDNNVDATQRLLEACVGRPLHRFVYASSSSVYGDNVSIPMREDALPQPVSPYGVTKLAAEQLCYLYYANYRVPTARCATSPSTGRGSVPTWRFHKFMRAALRGDAITLYGDGEQTRDFTFVTDAVAATIAAGDRGRWGVPTTSAADRVSRSTSSSRSSPAFTASRSPFGGNPCRRATCATRSPTRPGPVPISGSRRRCRWSKAWRPSIDGWRARRRSC